MATLQPPNPGEPRPLSAHERRVLAHLENELISGDPGLAALAAGADGSRRRRSWLDELLQVAAVITILAVILPSQWLISVVILVVLFGPAIVALIVARPTSRSTDDESN